MGKRIENAEKELFDKSQDGNWKEVDRYGRLSCLQNSGRNREGKILLLKSEKSNDTKIIFEAGKS